MRITDEQTRLYAAHSPNQDTRSLAADLLDARLATEQQRDRVIALRDERDRALSQVQAARVEGVRAGLEAAARFVEHERGYFDEDGIEMVYRPKSEVLAAEIRALDATAIAARLATERKP